MNELLTKYPSEVQQTLLKYPTDRKRSAVMPLLYLAQREAGYITKQGIEDIADVLGMSATDVVSIIGFYTLYHDQPGGRYRIQVCTDLPCALRGADEFLEKLCQNLGIRVGETTSDGLFTIEEVKCLAGCHRAPLFQLQGDGEINYYENQTVETAAGLMNQLRQLARDASQIGEVDK
ncbi:MAG: NAD(P)H-dependent oxidoreductase subunit E [Anaerolineaceae bacterium]|nr:NAD(P)H-dependent oxidoreductase subunit E [Anaerolineaceae bacterium]